MPIEGRRKGETAEAAVSRIVAELMRAYKATGKIGATRPKNAKHAMKIASAIAHNRVSGKG